MLWGVVDKLIPWHIHSLVSEIEVVHRTGIKRQEARLPSDISTKVTKETLLDNKVPVSTLSNKSFEVEEDLKLNKNKKRMNLEEPTT